MTTNAQTYQTILEAICNDTIAPAAPAVDRDGVFPEKSIEALKTAGLLGAMSGPASGGSGLGLPGAAQIVGRVAEECASTAMVLCMHYCGTAILEAHASEPVRRAAADGEHLSTLAFSEAGSRSHFWAPVSTAQMDGDTVILNAQKSWVTSASRATAYVWSSKPSQAEGASTIWLVPAQASGLTVQSPFEGLGLRGNDSSPSQRQRCSNPSYGDVGRRRQGFRHHDGHRVADFQCLERRLLGGLMESAVRKTAAHASGTRHSDTGATLADLPTIRNYIARMKVKADAARTLLDDTIAAIQANRSDTMLRVLECKAAAGETATEVLDLAMRVCGGAAFRKDVAVERYFRDTRAAGVMAPTTDVLYDFLGKAVCGLPLF